MTTRRAFITSATFTLTGGFVPGVIRSACAQGAGQGAGRRGSDEEDRARPADLQVGGAGERRPRPEADRADVVDRQQAFTVAHRALVPDLAARS